MDCTQATRARRSIRKYKPGAPVPEEDIRLMLEAAMMAPSARNTRPWEFFVVEDPELKAKLRSAHPFASMLDTASLAIVVCGRPENQSGKAEGYWPLDCGAAVENLLLQATALGYGCCWCGCWPSPRAAALQELLNTRSVPTALIAVGVPDEEPPARGFYEPEKVTWLRGQGGPVHG